MGNSLTKVFNISYSLLSATTAQECLFELITLRKRMASVFAFIAALTNDHKIGGLKQNTFISKYWRSEV